MRFTSADNIKHKVVIPFDMADQIDPASRTPFLKETEKAYGFKVNGVLIWMPKSQLELFTYDANGDRIEFWCKQWLITEKSLEIFVDTSYEPGLFGQSEFENMNDDPGS